MNSAQYLPPPSAANPIPTDLTDTPATAWVTMSRINHPVLGLLLIQKRDGESRTIIGECR